MWGDGGLRPAGLGSSLCVFALGFSSIGWAVSLLPSWASRQGLSRWFLKWRALGRSEWSPRGRQGDVGGGGAEL